MAVIDRKLLLKNYQWSKLSPSARTLLNALATCTNKEGVGNPSWNGLMFYSGIVGKDTFKKARQQLIDEGLVKVTKKWNITNDKDKKIPRAVVTYQITESILWNKRPSNQSKLSNNNDTQSMDMGSMDSGKESVNSLGVFKKDVNKQPSAVNLPIKGTEIRDRSKPTAIGETIVSGYSHLTEHSGSSGIGDIRYEWQYEAERLAKYLGISHPSKSWFKFFKDSFAQNRKFLLQSAAVSMVDAPNIEDKEKYFFKLVYELYSKG